ncbi:histidinol phosphatase-like enzyme (inositol monophosphatase family) [Azospirillum brasilense]|uniref:Histidinol-phosphatase n=1 Tax=Azospirillum brasilense TaxID=192 RepID=A0A560BFI9_AZOBR|nr:histidinol-phosphatase [Azospirillum brasilense]TWA71322.1 histidinol phosphatase-like enzyme (inositol monophosphatase family) [Azospirillum brasilense]
MTEPCPTPLVTLAERLADASGPVIRQYFRTPVAVDDKADASPVTIADREAERTIRAIIEAERPGDGIYGEEFGTKNLDAEWVWVIDPIDGTKSFITGRPIFGTLIALLHRGRPVLGVIDQPIVRDRWLGVEGRPTLFNGQPARVRECVGGLVAATLGTTSPDLFPGADQDAFRRVAGAAKVSVYGGDCYSYGLLAAGYYDLVVESGLKLYDFAALVPVVTGAGGLMTDWDGRPLDATSNGRVVAAGDARTHRETLAALAG